MRNLGFWRFFIFFIVYCNGKVFSNEFVNFDNEEVVLSEAVMKRGAVPVSFETRLTIFLDFLRELQGQGLLDGEVEVVRNGQSLLHLLSDDIAFSDASNGPQFMIGSVSKQFFAVALLKSLYESSFGVTEEAKITDVKRKLHLPISQFLPKESTIWGGDMPSWAQEVSLHHLLTHTSGIQNYTNDTKSESEISGSIDVRKHWFEFYHSASQIIKRIAEEPLLFPPGSKYSYCNTGYVIIAEVIEAITSLSATQYIQQSLFSVIGLSSTASPIQGRWDVLRLNSQLSRLVAPFEYDLKGDQMNLYSPLRCKDISVAKGGGSIISTSADLLKWNQALHKEKSVLPKDLYSLLITPNMDNYGYGIGIESSGTELILGHSGGIGSYRTLLLYMPEHDLSIVVLSNICYDFDKIEGDFKDVMKSLRDIIPDEKEGLFHL